MKRFVALVAVLLIFAAMGLNNNALIGIAEGKTDAEYEFYLNTDSSLDFKLANISDLTVLKNGAMTIVRCSPSSARQLRSTLGIILGEAVSYNAASDNALTLLIEELHVKISADYTVGETRIVEGLSSYIGNGINLEGRKVNIQIAYRHGRIKVGTPLILGSA